MLKTFFQSKNNFYATGSTHSNNETDLESGVGHPQDWKWDTEMGIAELPSVDWYYLTVVATW